jgi:hypothetical protein
VDIKFHVGANIKGVKIINNQNALLVNKYSNAIQQQSMNNTYQYEKEQYMGTGSSTKNSKINNILNDFEKTKNFNKELLKNIGSPKGPMFARGNQEDS